MKNFPAVFLLLISSTCFSQKSKQAQYLADSAAIMKNKLVRPQLKFDNRQTFYEGQKISLNGFDAGVLLKDKMRLTLGYYKLNDELDNKKLIDNGIPYSGAIQLDYWTLNTEIIYLNKRYFSLGLPLELGAGKTRITTKNEMTDEITDTRQGLLALSHFGLSATFKPIRWLGLKGMIGYRKTVYNQIKDFQFDGIFSSLGLNFDFREIIKDVRMLRLRKKYAKGNLIENAVDLITD